MPDWLLLLLVLSLIVAASGASIGAVAGTIDAVRLPAVVFEAASYRKSRWVWQAVGVCCLPVAAVYSGWYFVRVRPRLQAAQRQLGIGVASYGPPLIEQAADAGADLASTGGDSVLTKTVKIRAHPVYRALGLAPLLILCVVWALAASNGHASPPKLLVIEWMVAGPFLLVAGSWFGVNLTPEGVVVNGFRRRRISWADIDAVTRESFFGGQRIVLWTSDGARVPLRAPVLDITRLGRRRFDAGFHTIGRSWLLRRGA